MRRFLLGIALLLGLVVHAAAEERIKDFISDVAVNSDASLTVRETITVNAEGDRIRHGIFRDFPTVYDDAHGVRMRPGFDVIAVKRDGVAENYTRESIGNGVRVKIGNADNFVSEGIHSYEIVYRTTRQIGFFDNYDELYWNVTGNGWPFAIDHAEALVRLPEGAEIGQNTAYTGRQGQAGRDYAVIKAEGNTYRAETTRRLEPSEGFTIAVAWQKGLVAEPSQSDKWRWWISDNAGVFGLLATLLIASLYYFYAWNKVGRDPPKGTIIPLFSPPDGLGAAGSRFVWKEGFDDRGFAAGIVGLAVKGGAKNPPKPYFRHR